MRAIVLVGGFGTRLRPLTSDLPKQMLPVVDRPMIEHVVGHLAANGVDEVVLSLGFLPDAFREAYPDGACAGVPLHYAVEPEPLDTAGAIRFAAEDAGIDDTFLVLNGDVLTDLPFGELVEAHRATGAEGTISLTPVDDPSRYGVVPTDGSGRVLGFVAGGNNMHLLDGVRNQMTCVAFVHEVAAGIAAEYFNEVAVDERAFVLVTAGPGLTNITTAMAGAFLESRDLLVVGGQVKSTDLADGGIRQRGIQEVDGISMVRPVCVDTMLMTEPAGRKEVLAKIHRGRTPRKGPVFIEICLDAQAAPVERSELELDESRGFDWSPPEVSEGEWNVVAGMFEQAKRPALLLGGGVSREAAAANLERLRDFGVPLLTTWNAMDRVGSDEPLHFGRPDTWGQRRANIVMQSTDLLIVIGARLGLQQTGFNWQQFTPAGRVVQVEIDQAELDKGHPVVDLPICADADRFLEGLLDLPHGDISPWISFCEEVRDLLPLSESSNSAHPGYQNPYEFSLALADLCTPEDIFVPCSSGGSLTVQMQAFEQKLGQVVVSDKGLASMGYGLAGAIGAAIAGKGRRTILTEGDGGFSQNLQELAIASVRNLPLKLFLHVNEGYASIRMTQKNYFGGDYLGCDTSTGLGFPDWLKLFDAYGIPVLELGDDGLDDPAFGALFDAPGPAAFIVNVHPEQTYFPKISSRVLPDGGMESNPLHLMSPDLEPEVAAQVHRHLPTND